MRANVQSRPTLAEVNSNESVINQYKSEIFREYMRQREMAIIA